ncbi:hypothetical protein D3C75_891510 [compost metagenome]
MSRFWQTFANDARNRIYVHAVFRRNRHDVEEVHLATEELQMRQQNAFILHVIDFVHCQNHRRSRVTQFVKHHFIVCGPLGPFNDENNQLNITDGAARSFVHQAVDSALFFHMQPWGIDVNRLIRAFGMDTHNAVTSGLRFTGSDRNFLPKQLV